MNCPNFRKISPLYKLILAIVLLLIFCATTTNGSYFVDIFDIAIREFIGQSVEPELTSNKGSEEQIYLTYKNAALILKEIEEKVADKLIVAESKSNQIDMGSFYGALNEMNKALYGQEMQWKSGRNSEYQQGFEESVQPEQKKRVYAEFFHRLLTFAIRMGFHIGHNELNAALMHEGKSPIDLLKFVHAQNALEKMYTDFVKNYLAKQGNSTNFWTQIRDHSQRVWFDNASLIPHPNLLKLIFNPPDEAYKHYAINQNLDTIEWLLLNSPKVTIQGWLQLVKKIQYIHLHESSFMGSSNIVENLLKQLVTSWTGARIDRRHNFSTIQFCTAKKFAINLIKRLEGVKKMENYLGGHYNAQTEFIQFTERINNRYKKECNYEKLRANGNENIMDEKDYQANDILMLNTEPFLHYEDAILFNEVKTDEEIRKEDAKATLNPIWSRWYDELAGCQITWNPRKEKDQQLSLFGNFRGTPCDLKQISADLLKFKDEKSSENAELTLLELGSSLNTFDKDFHYLENELKTANQKIHAVQVRKKPVYKRLSRGSSFDDKKQEDIQAIVSQMTAWLGGLQQGFLHKLLADLRSLMEGCVRTY